MWVGSEVSVAPVATGKSVGPNRGGPLVSVRDAHERSPVDFTHRSQVAFVSLHPPPIHLECNVEGATPYGLHNLLADYHLYMSENHHLDSTQTQTQTQTETLFRTQTQILTSACLGFS